MRCVSPGEVIRTTPLNDIVRKLEQRSISVGVAGGNEWPAIMCEAYNDTGRDLAAGEAALLGDLGIFDYAEFLSNPVLRMIDPTGLRDTLAKWVVAADAIPAGMAGPVFESGIFLAKIRYKNFQVKQWSNAEFIAQTRNSPTNSAWSWGERNDWWHLLPSGIGSAQILVYDNTPQTDEEGNLWAWAIVRYGGHTYVPSLWRVTYIDPALQYILAVPYIENEDGSADGAEERRFNLPNGTI